MVGNSPQRLLLRAARRIHDALRAASVPEPFPMIAEPAWYRCQAANRRWHVASRHGWQAAATRIRADLARSATALIRDLMLYRDEVADVQPSIAVQPVREIYRDLVALHLEFDNVRIDFPNCEVTATTPPIVFDDVDLGPFEIALGWNRLHTSRPYRVKALNPKTACSDSSTTHPHVRDDVLCEGDGKGPIRGAMQSGRLLDFFLLVRQVLGTYNAGSAHAVLEDWNTAQCPDCGNRMPDATATSCARCDRELCIDCTSCCKSCACRCCSECCDPCSGCRKDCCTRCMTECSVCGSPFCPNCLVDDQCLDCMELEQESYEDDTETTTDEIEAVAPHPAFQPVCLGQAAVPA